MVWCLTMLKESLWLMTLTSPSKLVVTKNSSPYKYSQLSTTDSFSMLVILCYYVRLF